MKLFFYGAAKEVTGSCYCVEANGNRILIDCGLKQGQDDEDGNALPFSAPSINHVIVTHAHIDHSGRIPLLVKQGYRGEIVTTRLTAKLLGIMLRDSAFIQEKDVEWDNRKGKRAGRPVVEPLYTVMDAEIALKRLQTAEYGEKKELCEGVFYRFSDAGHILGSACVELWITEGGVTKKLVFTGDLGNVAQPIIRDPQPIKEADYLITESTYGDRNHEPSYNYTEALAAIFDRVFSRGGNVIIPSFAVGRTQELLYFIREMKDKKMVPGFPEFPVYLDSPLAKESTMIFSDDLRGYLDAEALDVVKGGEKMLIFPGLTLVESSEESKALNTNKIPKVIISASGMCDAGRVRHHLKHNLWRPESAVVLVGYQAQGSLGRRLLDGEKEVRLFDEEINVSAEIINFKGLSSHADRDHLLAFAEYFSPRPQHVFVTHGDKEIAELYAATLRERGFATNAADYMEVYDLAADRVLENGEHYEIRKEVHVESAYAELQSAGNYLLNVIARSRDMSEDKLRNLTEQTKNLTDKLAK